MLTRRQQLLSVRRREKSLIKKEDVLRHQKRIRLLFAVGLKPRIRKT